ncbi:NACHT domain-containing protein [Lasiosphaeris hirsuta]|uniref:NACHT domain-containing protein n=1 Tax=Lasiosphaeris hirsuta TaxID=260670 RepID=A0AA40B006_9PEZI|nr:NACHT domain-containing protein [Lasiosphaeris hirsuta]
MRLLERGDTGEFHLTKHLPNDAIPPYAILSHTWREDEEVLFKDLADDTCCIDKSDGAELQHALNSMFRWYRNAAKCYVYLADVSTSAPDNKSSWEAAFRASKWFTRGWTLQELIAPTIIEFFSIEGQRLGDKKSLERQIHEITGIPLGALRGGILSDFSIDERMAWVKKRNTTREEDKAYSLFGIFDVHMPLLYGEGEVEAFGRLRERIDKDYHRLADLRSADPRLEKERIEEAKGGLVVNAYRRALESLNLDRWHLPENRMFWIRGGSGKGKTMLLCGIINELERAMVAGGHCHNLAYYFCQATDSRINSAIAVLRGLIYLLVHRQPRLLSRLPENIYPSDNAIAWIVLSRVFREMLEDPNLKVTYLVIDALDECITDLPKLLDLIVCTSSERVKWLVASQNRLMIERKLRFSDRLIEFGLGLETNVEQVSCDIDGYIDNKLSGLISLWELSKGEVESWHVLPIVEDVPRGLDGMYERMLTEIEQYRWDADFCRRILSVVTVTYRPLHLAEIGALSRLLEQITKSTENVRKIVAKCRSFLTVRDNRIYLVHQSAKDYLSDRASTLLFPHGVAMAHHDILDRSMKLLSDKLQYDIYGLYEPEFPIDQVRVPDPDPLTTVRYSCVYWVNHLSDSISGTNVNLDTFLQDDGAVHTFLKTKYLYWLETLSLLRAMSEGVIAVGQLKGLLTLEGHGGWVRSVAFSPDGQRLVSGSYDQTIKIWDPESGQCLQTENVDRPVYHVSFDHTGRYLITDAGRIDITIAITESVVQPGYLGKQEYGFGCDKLWVTCNGKNVLWLPPEYRPSCSAVYGRMVSIGCSSGRVLTIGFSRNV